MRTSSTPTIETEEFADESIRTHRKTLSIRFGAAVIAVWVASAGPLAPMSTAAAQQSDVELCTNLAHGPALSEPIWCITPRGVFLAQFDLLTPFEGSLAVRQVDNLLCTAIGFDVLGRAVGVIEVSVEQGATEGCFRRNSGRCANVGTIEAVGLRCVDRR